MKPIVFGLIMLLAGGCDRDDLVPTLDPDAGTCEITAEECNGLDDDCDGEADEDAEGAGAPCRVGVGACGREGVEQCFGGRLQCNVIAATPGIERCDGVDDDCDGTIDEDSAASCPFPNAGRYCQDGECRMGECAPGFFNLDGNDENGCEADCAPQNGGVELCNTMDDDCDGQTDEGFDFSGTNEHCGGCHRECTHANAVSVCVDGQCELMACNGGFQDYDGDLENGCEGVCGDLAEETCDGEDTDCDGTIDEDSAIACGGMAGACMPGTRQCVNGALAPCTGVEPVDERCDGLDNDCDESTDEAFDLQTDVAHCGGCDQLCAPASANGVCVMGECAIAECFDGFGDLDGNPDNGCEVGCSPEICDGADNDCDGTVDETFDLQASLENCGECGHVCEVGNAAAVCQAGVCVIEACPPNTLDLDGDIENGCEHPCGDPGAPEVCNGLDEDCDGLIDEDFALDEDPNHCGGCNQLCAPANGEGVCQGGLCIIIECGPDWVDADGDVDTGCECELGRVAVGADVCHGIDADCDGLLDVPLRARCCAPDDVQPPCNGCPADSYLEDGWVCIPAGQFTIGSPPSEDEGDAERERPQHLVTLTQPFVMMATEVTQAQWSHHFVNDPSINEGRGEPCDNCPVDNVNWFEAVSYANQLSRTASLEECYPLTNCQGEPGTGMQCDDVVAFRGLQCTGYRLPTSAEWEYAARAGALTRYWSGDTEADLAGAGWYGGNSSFGNRDWQSHAVGLAEANPWGLFDVHGNVFEWTHDWYGPYGPDEAINPLGAVQLPIPRHRVVRGGSFRSAAADNRAAARSGAGPSSATYLNGFRLVRRFVP